MVKQKKRGVIDRFTDILYQPLVPQNFNQLIRAVGLWLLICLVAVVLALIVGVFFSIAVFLFVIFLMYCFVKFTLYIIAGD